MAWEVIQDSEIDSESEIHDLAPSTFKKIRDNLTALLAGTGGAPPWLNDAFTDNNIAGGALSVMTPIPPAKLKDGAVNSSGMITAGSIGVSKLSIGTGYLLFGDNTYNIENTPSPLINPGGTFFLGYRAKMEDAGYAGARYLLLRFSGMGAVNTDKYVNKDMITSGSGDSPFGLTYMYARIIAASTLPRIYAEISYLEASPPYHLGGYEAPFFLYAMLGPDGTPVGWWGAGAPPWAYNGPTDITPNHTKDGKRYRRRRRLPYRWADTRGNLEKMDANLDAVVHGDFEDIEITPEFKNSDMAIVPHPFTPPAGCRVVMVDPLSHLVGDLRRMDLDGEPVGEVFDPKYLDLGSDPIPGAPGPPGVPVVRASWRVS